MISTFPLISSSTSPLRVPFYMLTRHCGVCLRGTTMAKPTWWQMSQVWSRFCFIWSPRCCVPWSALKWHQRLTDIHCVWFWNLQRKKKERNPFQEHKNIETAVAHELCCVLMFLCAWIMQILWKQATAETEIMQLSAITQNLPSAEFWKGNANAHHSLFMLLSHRKEILRCTRKRQWLSLACRIIGWWATKVSMATAGTFWMFHTSQSFLFLWVNMFAINVTWRFLCISFHICLERRLHSETENSWSILLNMSPFCEVARGKVHLQDTKCSTVHCDKWNTL